MEKNRNRRLVRWLNKERGERLGVGSLALTHKN